MVRIPDEANQNIQLDVPLDDDGLGIREISRRGKRMSVLGKRLRDKILAPKPRKTPPVFSAAQVADLCGIDRHRISYLIKRGTELPHGVTKGATREFTLEDTLEWLNAEKKVYQRTEHSKGAILASTNFKGGSTKSTTAMCLAQGLTLRGRKVLVVDLDPQGSITELCGYYADIEIKEEHTLAPFISSYVDEEPMTSLAPLVRNTYWKNLDIIPASAALFGSEFNFPAIIRKRPDTKIWTLLREGLAPLRAEYDFICLDCAPSLSYLTVNALMAADTIVMPLVPDSLDFISSLQFWSLFGDLTDVLAEKDEDKTYDMIQIVLSKVDSSSSAVSVIRHWAKMAYGGWMFGTEIPYSSAASVGAIAFNTVFDQMKGTTDASKKTIERLRNPLNELVKHIDDFYSKKWEKQEHRAALERAEIPLRTENA